MGKGWKHPEDKPGEKSHLREGLQESIYPDQHETNIADGDEFLDDALRMKDQPYENKETDENERPRGNFGY